MAEDAKTGGDDRNPNAPSGRRLDQPPGERPKPRRSHEGVRGEAREDENRPDSTPEPCIDERTTKSEPGREVTREDDNLNLQNATHAQEPTVGLQVSPDDAETLLRLRDAGLIDLDGLGELHTENREVTDWTYKEFRRHMVASQGLSTGTAKCRVRYVRYLEEHADAPVDLRPPSEGSWQDHVFFRRENGATGSALNHYRKAMKSLLSFLGLAAWGCLDSQFKESKPSWTLPEPDVAAKYWTAEDEWGYDLTPFRRTTFAHVFHFGFHTGVRAPSEIAALDLDDVRRDRGEIVVTEKKKAGNRRRMRLPSYILDAGNSKSLGNYIDHHRPANTETNAVFVMENGQRWDEQYLRTQLSRIGKRIWPDFHPYTMRRYFATELMIATDFNVYKVAKALGDTVAVVERHYIDPARARAEMDTDHIPRLRRDGNR